jgi:hypothetical protein
MNTIDERQIGQHIMIVGWYGMIVGLLMVGQWVFFLATGLVPELQTEPVRIYFHLAAELATAITLMVSGIALIRKLAWAGTVYFIAVGSLLYSLIVSPGYFAQQGEWMMVALFGLLAGLAITIVVYAVHAASLGRAENGL